ncbi:hypothetical protein [Bradyrhizobium sp. SZCCHNS3002]|uniref:hypothetical protein n=1 Tax=Bradyrhizobium sp. SZCCHNS3002 TaxID=3057310 RepID=UPI0028E885E0|nr:hypothetical protein [Bradyrhizobium sp. SZCCHNS3002]
MKTIATIAAAVQIFLIVFFPFEAVMVSIEPISEGLDQHFGRQSGHDIGSYQC